MSSHESTPSGSREIKISRRGVLTGLFAGAGAAALAACGREAIPVGTSETPEAPTTPSETPSVEVTPSETQSQTPEAVDIHNMTIDDVKDLSDEQRASLREQFESMSEEEFYALPLWTRLLISADTFHDNKNRGWIERNNIVYGDPSGLDISDVNPYELTPDADPDTILKSYQVLQQISLDSAGYDLPVLDDMKKRGSCAFLIPDMDLDSVASDLAEKNLSGMNPGRVTSGAIFAKEMFLTQAEQYEKSFDTEDKIIDRFKFDPSTTRSGSLTHGVYEEPLTGEVYENAIRIPAQYVNGGSKGDLQFVFVENPSKPNTGIWLFAGNDFTNSVTAA